MVALEIPDNKSEQKTDSSFIIRNNPALIRQSVCLWIEKEDEAKDLAERKKQYDTF